MLYFLIFGCIILFLGYIFYEYKIHIDFKSLFKKGFKKDDSIFGLYTFTGHQGNGKTYSAVKFCEHMSKDKDTFIVTNVSSFCICNDKDTIYIPNINQLIEFVIACNGVNGKKFIVFFDEIFTILMKGTRLNNNILSFLAQLRKRGIIFVTTAQYWSEIPITFRRFCRYQIACNMLSLPFIKSCFCINKVNDGYNCKWNNDTQDFESPLLQTNISKGNKYIIQLYNTLETISMSDSNR